MKKIILFVTFLCALCGNSFSQEHLLGIKGGVNWMNWTNNYSDFKQGFLGGVTYDYTINKHFVIGVEALYSQAGNSSFTSVTDEQGNFLGEGDWLTKFDYFSIPIKVGYILGDKYAVYGNIGIAPSYLINTSITLKDVDAKYANTQKIDVAGLIEAGFKYKINEDLNLNLSLTYQHGFIHVFDVNADKKLLNYGYSVNAGLKYRLK